MAYTRINWANIPATTTPINATNLNVMDAGIKENDDKLLGNKPMGSIVVEDVIGKNILNFKDSGYLGILNTSSEVIFLNSLAVNTSTNTNTRFFKKIPVGTTLTVSVRVIEGIDSFESGWTQIGISLNYIDGAYNKKILEIPFENKNNIQFVTFTTEKEVESIDMAYGCNIVVSNSSRVVVGLMLETGTQATSYVPFKNFDATYHEEVIFSSSISTGTPYDLSSGKKFSDYDLLAFTFLGYNQTVVVSRREFEAGINVELKCYENYTSKTYLLICASYNSDNSIQCVKSAYTNSSTETWGDNPYPLRIKGIKIGTFL